MVAETLTNLPVPEKPEFTIKDNIVIGNDTNWVPSASLSKYLLDSMSKNPLFVNQIDAQSGETLTFEQLKDRSIRCALWLKKQGVGKDDVICISTPNQINDCVPLLATFYVGAISNPWYHDLTPAIARYFFEMIKPKVMFAHEKFIDLLAQAAKETQINCKFIAYGKHIAFQSLQDIMKEQTEEEVKNFQPVEPVDPKKQVAAIFFSSGTTGRQKGTMLSYNTILYKHMGYLNMKSNMTALWYSSLSWITGTYFTIYSIIEPLTRIIHAESDPHKTSQVIQKYKVDWTFMTPSLLIEMCKAKVFDKYNLTSLEIVNIGGSKASKLMMEEVQQKLPNAFVQNGYGMTESGGPIAWKSRGMQKKIDTVGCVLPGSKMKVIDTRTEEALGPNQLGELCVKTDDLMLGYYNKPQETKEVIDYHGWLHTGDLGFYDENGDFTIMDRIKQVIISQNHHISPSQIEEILIKHPAVADVAVVPVPHSVDIERPLAFVVKAPNVKVTEEELMELPAKFDKMFKLTGGVVFITKIPYTSTGKVCVRDLKEMAKAYAK